MGDVKRSFWETLHFRLLRRAGLRAQEADEIDPDEAQEGEDLFHRVLLLRQHPRQGRRQRILPIWLKVSLDLRQRCTLQSIWPSITLHVIWNIWIILNIWIFWLIRNIWIIWNSWMRGTICRHKFLKGSFMFRVVDQVVHYLFWHDMMTDELCPR